MKKANGTFSETVKPLFRSGPFTSKPQRYDKCVVKDNDAFLVSKKDGPELIRRPIRIVMNNQTLTIFGDDSYTRSMYSFQMETSSLKKVKDFCCISVTDSHKQVNLCGYETDCGNKMTNPWATGWENDFHFFKYECFLGRAKQLLSPGDEHKLVDEYQGRLNFAKEELVRLKGKEVEKEQIRKEKRTQRGALMKTQNDAWVVIQKEMDLEAMIKKEEKEKEGVELEDVAKVLEKEKKRKQCMKKTLKKREQENRRILDKRENKKEIKGIKKELKIEVELKRNELKRQVAQMRARLRRKKAAMEDKINRVRASLAKEMMAANKIGDIMKCKKGKDNAMHRDSYCNAEFNEDYIKNIDCKVKENFCYTCCENEFGNAFLEKREECYDMCDGKEVQIKTPAIKKASKKKPDEGGWVWVQHPPVSITTKI